MHPLSIIYQYMGTGLPQGDIVWTNKDKKKTVQKRHFWKNCDREGGPQQLIMMRHLNRDLRLYEQEDLADLEMLSRPHENFSWGGSMRESK